MANGLNMISMYTLLLYAEAIQEWIPFEEESKPTRAYESWLNYKSILTFDIKVIYQGKEVDMETLLKEKTEE